ncbi:MAG: hypothetical protein K6C34_00845 [Alphaproteobacteria bacterium]|nr:hypothetical protein [Alphaproteobacteria bacterium]
MTKIIWKLSSVTRIGDDIDTMVIVEQDDVLFSNEKSAYRNAVSHVLHDYVRFTSNLVERYYERPTVKCARSELGVCGRAVYHFMINENNPFEINNVVNKYFVNAVRILD